MSNALTKIARAVKTEINPALIRPKSARLIITLNCNFRCKSCTFWYHPYWKDRKIDPSLDRVKHWIKEMAEFGIEEIDLGGGEPFIRKDLPEIVKEIKKYGMKCGLTTNGWFVSQVPFPDIDYCEVSIDGARPETNDKIRGINGAWQRAVDAVKLIKERNCPVHLNFVIQKENYKEIVEFCHLAKSLGVGATFIPISLKLAAQPNLPDDLNDYDLDELKRQLKEALKTGVVLNNKEFLKVVLDKIEKGPSPQKCLAPYRVILIFADSGVYPCGNFDQAMDYLTEDKKFKDIYENYEKMRQEVWRGEHEFCKSCVYGDVSTKGTILSSAIPFLKKTLTKKK